jgi:LPS-assembly lipoprotein
MSSSERPTRRRLLGAAAALAAPALLGACGLHPLYGGYVGQQVNPALAAIDIRTPNNQLGQQLKVALVDALNPAGIYETELYDLDVQLDQESTALAIQLNDNITRYDLTLIATYQLRRRADRAVLLRSATRRVASYNVVKAPYSTLVAKQDAASRALVEMSQEIRDRLAIQFAKREA